MLVREVMTSPAVTVQEDDTVRYAAELLLHHRIASAPVVDAGGRLVGIVSEADLLRGRTQRDPRAHLTPPPQEPVTDRPASSVRDVMSTRPLSVRAGADVDDAARMLLDHGIKAAPVVEGGRVVGVVARRDLLRSFARPDDDIRRDVLTLLEDLGQGSDWQVDVEDGVVHLYSPGGEPRQRIASVLARTVPGVVRVV
ncbi:CBS domain-containing protein [Kineosporiaceae bacterium SCSIO 59966]|nr:CBS domain-containing protein [Kineosporiaceae bacterium SCSIO 59966]